MADVGADELGLGAERAQLLSEFGTSCHGDDLVAFVGEGQGRGAADPGGPPVIWTMAMGFSCQACRKARGKRLQPINPAASGVVPGSQSGLSS